DARVHPARHGSDERDQQRQRTAEHRCRPGGRGREPDGPGHATERRAGGAERSSVGDPEAASANPAGRRGGVQAGAHCRFGVTES
ncbi:hypothetical protein ABTK13_22120, partial [Acinetobacter baumannii]